MHCGPSLHGAHFPKNGDILLDNYHAVINFGNFHIDSVLSDLLSVFQFCQLSK